MTNQIPGSDDYWIRIDFSIIFSILVGEKINIFFSKVGVL